MATLEVVSREHSEDISSFDLWNDPAWQRFGYVRSLAVAGESFRGRLEHGSFGLLSICRITATAHRVEHEAEKLSADSVARLKILIQIHGTCRFQQGDSTVELTPGDFLVYNPATAYSLFIPHAVEQIVLLVPIDRLPLGSDAGNVLAVAFQHNPVGRGSPSLY